MRGQVREILGRVLQTCSLQADSICLLIVNIVKFILVVRSDLEWLEQCCFVWWVVRVEKNPMKRNRHLRTPRILKSCLEQSP